MQSKYIGNTGTQSTTTRRWEYYNYFSSAPGTSIEVGRNGGSSDEMHIVVADEDGQFTGIANTIVEVHAGVSKALGAKSENGTAIYYRDYMNKNSRYVWWTAHATGGANIGKGHTRGLNWGTGVQSLPVNSSLSLGRDGALPRAADYINGYNLFRSAEAVDVSLILGGASDATRAIHIINNIAEYRKDCIAVLSPRQADVVNNSGYSGAEVDDIIAFRKIGRAHV